MTKPLSLLGIALLGSTLALQSCSSDNDDNGHENPTIYTWNPQAMTLTTQQQSLAPATNDFARRLALELRKEHGTSQDLFFSPMSATYALAMAANGAEGETLEQLKQVLGFDGNVSVEQINNYLHQVLTQSANLDDAVSPQVANALLADQTTNLKPDFVSAMSQYYEALATSVDFTSPEALNTVNQWASDHTNGMINPFLTKVNPNTKLMLLNAIYFDAPWWRPFYTNKTMDEEFTTESGRKDHVYMMKQTFSLPAAETDDCQMVSLPYARGSWSMVVMLPKEGKTIDDALRSIDTDDLKTLVQGTHEAELSIWLPRFETTTTLDLNDALINMGAPRMFDPGMAQFPYMAEQPQYIMKVGQKSTIRVAENGTYAATVTHVSTGNAMDIGPIRSTEFHCDHPFVYAIVERSTGLIFYMGMYTGD